MSKKLGRKIRIETPALRKTLTRAGRRADLSIPVLRIRGSGVFVLSLGIKRIAITRKPFVRKSIGRTPIRKNTKRTPIKRKPVKRTTIKRPTQRRPVKRKTTPRRPVPRKTPRRPVLRRPTKRRPVKRKTTPRRPVPRRPTPRKPTPRPGKPKPPVLRLNIPKSFSSRTLSKKQPTYYVVEKVRGKFKKLYPKPLTVKDAKDYAVYSIDNRLSKTAFFIPMGMAKKVVRPPKQIQNYYSRNSYKVRPYKIRYGKKRQMVNGYIEKRKYFNDTVGERGQLRNLKRRLSPQQRKVMLRNLSKAKKMRSSTTTKRSPLRRTTIQRRPTRSTVKQRSISPARSRPTASKTTIKRISPQQRRELLLRLKRARAVRMRNLRRR